MVEIDKLLEEPSQEIPKIDTAGLEIEGDALDSLTNTAAELTKQLQNMKASFDATNPYSSLKIPDFSNGSVPEDAFSRKKFKEHFGSEDNSEDVLNTDTDEVIPKGVKCKSDIPASDTDDNEVPINNAEEIDVSSADMNMFASVILLILLAIYYTIVRVGNVVSNITVTSLQNRILKNKVWSQAFAGFGFALIVAESARIAFAAGNTIRIVSGVLEVLLLIPIITLVITICYMEGKK